MRWNCHVVTYCLESRSHRVSRILNFVIVSVIFCHYFLISLYPSVCNYRITLTMTAFSLKWDCLFWHFVDCSWFFCVFVTLCICKHITVWMLMVFGSLSNICVCVCSWIKCRSLSHIHVCVCSWIVGHCHIYILYIYIHVSVCSWIVGHCHRVFVLQFFLWIVHGVLCLWV